MNIRWLKWALKKYAPDILSGMAVGGIFATALLGVRAGRKVANKVQTYYETVSPSLKQELSLTWKCYIPPVTSAILTSACMIGAHRTHLRNEAVLAAVATLYSKKYQQLAGAAKKTFDPEKYSEDTPPWLPRAKEGESVYYEPISRQYFTATPQAMLYAQLYINKLLQEYWGVTLNDYLNVLPGCRRVPEGSQIGWYQGTDDWQELWDNTSQEGVFIDIEFTNTQDGDKCICYNVYPALPGADWEPFK